MAHPVGTLPGMCEICDGMSYEEANARQAARIESHGYTMQPVGESDDDPTGWVYTIGLLDVADHAELIVAGVSPRLGVALLSAVATDVVDGDCLHVGDRIDFGDGIASVGAVHPIQYELGTFASWYRMKEHGAVHASELAAVQIVLPHFGFGRARSRQPRLDRVHERIDVSVPTSKRGRR